MRPPLARAQQEPGLHWSPRWARFSIAQYALTGAMGGVLIFGRDLYEDPSKEARWSGPILADSYGRSVLRAESPQDRATASRISDYLVYGLIAYPFADALWAAGGRGSVDVGFQMTLINLQANFLQKLLSGLTKNLTARARPDAAECLTGNEPSCSAQSRSFFSGHTGTAFTGAGLVCAHHENLRLYGNRTARTAACAVALVAAAAVGTLRIVADRHHLSDVLVGAGVGLMSGYLLPNLIQYDFGASMFAGRIAPLGGPRHVGLQYQLDFQ